MASTTSLDRPDRGFRRPTPTHDSVREFFNTMVRIGLIILASLSGIGRLFLAFVMIVFMFTKGVSPGV